MVSGLVLHEGKSLGFYRNVAAADGESAELDWSTENNEKTFLTRLTDTKRTAIYGSSMRIFCKWCTVTTKYLMCCIELSCYQCAEIIFKKIQTDKHPVLSHLSGDSLVRTRTSLEFHYPDKETHQNLQSIFLRLIWAIQCWVSDGKLLIHGLMNQFLLQPCSKVYHSTPLTKYIVVYWQLCRKLFDNTSLAAIKIDSVVVQTGAYQTPWSNRY